MRNLLVGNGVNIQHGGYNFSNNAIVLRTLQNFTKGNFPTHILSDEPLLSKLHLGYLFTIIPNVLNGEYDSVANCTAEKFSISEFKQRYSNRKMLKMTDVGFEDYYLLHDLICHKCKVQNPEMFDVRESIVGCFLHSIFDNNQVNTLSSKYMPVFIEWLNTFQSIFTTNYDSNIDNVVEIPVHHLHGDFVTRKEIYDSDSFRNQLPDCPIKDCVIDENYPHLYSTALSTHSGSYKEMHLKQKQLANSGAEKFASAYLSNKSVKMDVDSWKNDENPLIANLYESIMLKLKNPDIEFKQQYPIEEFRAMAGELVILGLSPYNDKHIFEIINSSEITNCIFYFYDEKECILVKKLLPQKTVDFKPAKTFWNTPPKTSSAPISTREGHIKRIAKAQFTQFSNIARKMNKSIMADADIVNEYNRVSLMDMKEIVIKLKNIKPVPTLDSEQNLLLSAIDIHIIAEEYNIDPATIFFIGINSAECNLISLV